MVYVKLLKDISITSLQNKINRYIQQIPENDIITTSINSFSDNEYFAIVVTYNEQPRELEEYEPILVSAKNKHK